MKPNEAITKLERQRGCIDTLASMSVDNAGFKGWKRDTELAIRFAFGEDTRHVREFLSVQWTPGSYSQDDPEPEWHEAFLDGLREANALLNSMVREIKEYGLVVPAPNARASDGVAPTRATRDVFLVHGHDEGFKETVARFLDKLKLKPIVLHEKPNKGRTIIEKFVDYSDVSFAVILLTADDRGGLAGTPFEKQRTRARQNVILELGFFLGRLGRDRVCALYEHGVEIPSDYDGVLFVPFDKPGAWRMLLAREIKAVGISVDMNDVV